MPDVLLLSTSSSHSPDFAHIMIVDGRQIASGTTVEADLCVVGGGPAGITIAREFLHQSVRVLLLESGGTVVAEENQALCRGNTLGQDYPPMHLCRRRVLGGSSSYWGGWARPFDDLDFEERDWVPYSGWPFTRDELKREYERANAIWKLGECVYEIDGHNREVRGLLNTNQTSFAATLFRINAIRFGKAYRTELESSGNVDLLLHANVLEVEMDENHTRAVSLQVGTLSGSRFAVKACNFVLAAGGLENPRILLASRRVRACGIGNEHDLVGRFFAEHLHVQFENVPLNGQHVPPFYHLRESGETAVRGGLALSEDTRRRDKLLGFAVTIHNPDSPHDLVHPIYTSVGYVSFATFLKPLPQGELPDLLGYHFGLLVEHPIQAINLALRKVIKLPWRSFAVGCRAEQVPNPESRVLLDDEKDAFGMNKVRLDWRLTSQDIDSIRRAQRLLECEWNFLGKGSLGLKPNEDAGLQVTPASHHMGTTRMHRDPKQGVVDEMCRVHGLRNVYVAGSSVFPTTGWAPPSLTMVALALRLADHLKRSRN